MILVLLLAGILLYQFVSRATTNISEALAEEVLEQQRDVAELLHQYSAVSLSLSEYQRSPSNTQRDLVVAALKNVSSQLEIMRSNYSFERLDGAANAHAYVKPVIEDVNQWVTLGIGYYDEDQDYILELASQRLADRINTLRSIAQNTDQTAQSLISEQRGEISSFRDSLLTLLLSFAVLMSLIIFLLIRQRNLQAQITRTQQMQSQSVIEAESRGRRKAEIALSESANIQRKILDAVPENIVMIDSKGKIVTANKQWRDLAHSRNQTVIDGGIGTSFNKVYDLLIDEGLEGRQELLDNINFAKEHGTELRSKEYMLGQAEARQWIEISALPFISEEERHTLLVHRNVTERKHLEARDRKLIADMAHVSRLSSAGELATGLAHELNQPLTAISHNCHAALTDVMTNIPSNHDLVETLEDTYRIAQRAGNIIRSMRRFTRKEADVRIPTDINHLIEETIRLTRPEAREKGVAVSLVLLENVPKIEIDPVQIQQVLVNLERNSVEAMSALTSETKNLTITTALTDKNELCISVEDTGPGLSKEVENTLFSTFQTTKNDSMGLGLAISRSIVEAHGGKLWVDKNTKAGVTFRFTLPLSIESN